MKPVPKPIFRLFHPCLIFEGKARVYSSGVILVLHCRQGRQASQILDVDKSVWLFARLQNELRPQKSFITQIPTFLKLLERNFWVSKCFKEFSFQLNNNFLLAVNILKLFSPSLTVWQNKLECLSSTNSVFASNVRAYSSGDTVGFLHDLEILDEPVLNCQWQTV